MEFHPNPCALGDSTVPYDNLPCPLFCEDNPDLQGSGPNALHTPTQAARSKSGKAKPTIISARQLDAIGFKPIKYVVPGYIAEGCTLIAGRPKLGKSWLCLDMALSVAGGGSCLGGVSCEAGDVLYLALEDNRRRLQSRIRTVWQEQARAGVSVPERLEIATEWPRANEGGIEAIRNWIDAHPSARLVIVDVLAMFKATTRDPRQTHYAEDYNAIKGLQSLAMETGIAITIVTHTRKSGAETDPFEKVSGTLGLSGAADTTIVLDRDQNGCTLYGRGRDLIEFETAVQFDPRTCRWRALGNAADVRCTDERAAILKVLTDAREAMTPHAIAVEANMKRNNVDRLLGKMAKTGETVKVGRGRYVHPSRSDLLTDTHTSPPGTNGKKVRNGYSGEECVSHG